MWSLSIINPFNVFELFINAETSQEVLFYVRKTMDNGWIESVLENQIDSGIYDRHGKVITNFSVKFLGTQSDLASQTLKNPYNFDFLTLREEYDEKELKDALVNQITQFLSELGYGIFLYGQTSPIFVLEQVIFIWICFYTMHVCIVMWLWN